MGYVCDYCGKQRAMVYCRSDLASLCLSCDQSVHSANALSKRHSRALLCERCHTQPAYVRCTDEGVSFCQKCDWLLHGDDSSSTSHKKQAINSYSGCPSAAEFSTFWPFIMDLPLRSPDESNYEGDLGSLTIEENGTKNSLVDKDSGEDKSAFWMGSPSIPELLAPQCLEQLRDPPSPNLGAALDSLQKTNFSGNKAPTIYEDDPYADLDMDEVDLNFENYEELFGVTLTNSEKLLENGGIDSLFASQHMSTANSNCQSALGAEGSSIGLINSVQPACSNAASGDSVMSIKTEPNLAFTARQAHSGLSFSRLSGESSGGDYQDCGASSMLLLGEPPWCPSGPDGSLQSASREKAVMRYKEKKKSRKFDKKVRYASRKARADVRQRVKGRFIKAGDAFDYDPLSQTRSF